LLTQKQLYIADQEAIKAIRSRLQVPIKPINGLCGYCGTQADIAHEDTCKGAERRWISRHDQINRAIFNALNTKASLKAEIEPQAGPASQDWVDLAATIGSTRRYYDLQIVALNKLSRKDTAYGTLDEAAKEKSRKYAGLGPQFQALIISSGGLMNQSTSKAWKAIQSAIGPTVSEWLDKLVSIILTRIRAYSAASIASQIPRSAEPNWKATRKSLSDAREACQLARKAN
jgi:hypothetical protein